MRDQKDSFSMRSWVECMNDMLIDRNREIFYGWVYIDFDEKNYEDKKAPSFRRIDDIFSYFSFPINGYVVQADIDEFTFVDDFFDSSKDIRENMKGLCRHIYSEIESIEDIIEDMKTLNEKGYWPSHMIYTRPSTEQDRFKVIEKRRTDDGINPLDITHRIYESDEKADLPIGELDKMTELSQDIGKIPHDGRSYIEGHDLRDACSKARDIAIFCYENEITRRHITNDF